MIERPEGAAGERPASAGTRVDDVLFRAVVEHGADVITLVDSGGTTLYASPSYERVFGLRPEDRVGLSAFARVHPDDLGALRGVFAALLARPGGTATAEFRIRHADGSWRHLAALAQNRLLDPAVGGVVITARDVTARVEAEEARRASDARFRAAFEDAGVGASLTALDGRFVEVNRALCELVGYPARELCAMRYQELTHPDDLSADLAQAERLLRGEARAYQLEKRYLHRDGYPVWVLLGVALVRDAAGAPQYFVSQVQDIGVRKQLEEDLRQLGLRDALTGCYNRRYLDDLARALAQRDAERAAAGRAVEEPTTWGCVYVDVDQFKRYNDVHGHAAGDAVLRGVSHFLARHVRAEEAVVRVGGDEFVLVVVGLDGARTREVAERLRAAATREAPVPLSLGWAAREGGESLHATIARADAHFLAARAAERAGERAAERASRTAAVRIAADERRDPAPRAAGG